MRTRRTRRTLGHRRRGVHFASTSCLLLAVLSACDPCAATFGCEQSPRVAVVGQIVDESTGLAVSGAVVEMRRQSGVAFVTESAQTTTREGGTFELDLPARDMGDAVVTMSVATPGKTPYLVPDVRVLATVQTGEATVLAPWVSANPTFPYVIEFYRNGTNDTRVTNAAVEFRRTGGVTMYSAGVAVNTARGTTDATGWVYLFQVLTADAAGNVVGDLVIRLPAPVDSAVLPGVTFPAVPLFRPNTTLVRLGVGPN